MITSTANPRIKQLARLKQRSAREETRTFPIEGVRAAARAAAAGWPIKELILAPDLAQPEARELAAEILSKGISVTEVGDAAFHKIAYRRHPDGILAVGETRELRLENFVLPDPPLVLVVEAIEKPGNLGAMLRIADGAGAAVIAADAATDVFNPNVVRASQGALFSVPIAVASAEDTARWLEAGSFHVVAARPDGPAAPWELDLTGPCAIVIGSEHAGLSPAWRDVETVTIPMRGLGDSLNAAAAAAIVVYEAVRQRA